jgi:excisionase family DNA binding protein
VRREKSTEISIETHRVLVISQLRKSAPAWCFSCRAQVDMVTPDEAAVLAGVSSRTIYRWVEAEKLHFTEMSDGLLRICLASLFAR